MTGYFSKLMHSTGLGSNRGALREVAAAPRPLDVDEVAFVEQPRAGLEAGSEAKVPLAPTDSRPASRSPNLPVSHQLTPPMPDAPKGMEPTSTSAPPSPRNDADGMETRRATNAPVTGVRHELSPVLEPMSPERVPPTSEHRVAAPRDEQLPELETPELEMSSRRLLFESEESHSDFAPDRSEAPSRERVYESVLAGIREWISTEAAPEQELLDDGAPRRRVLAAERSSSNELAAHSYRSRPGETDDETRIAPQEINLSVGTISIVIEEPPTQSVAQPAPSRAEVRSDISTVGPASLSRYYLRVR